jgi:ABC-2 type transport system permease protein
MLRIYLLEAKTEFLKFARMKTYSLTTILFPLMFYCFFGLAMGQYSRGPMPMARYLLATYGAFAVVGATLFAFGVGVAVERGLGWLQLKRASPMPALAYFVAKGAVAVTFGAIVVGLLFALGAIFGGVAMPAWQWLLLGGTLVAGSIPFCALGLAIGCFAGPNSAAGTVNLIYMPMAFCAGMWIPFEMLPKALQHVAPLLPTYHFSQIALRILNAKVQGTVLGHVAALAAFTLLFAALAWLGNAREREKMYG